MMHGGVRGRLHWNERLHAGVWSHAGYKVHAGVWVHASISVHAGVRDELECGIGQHCGDRPPASLATPRLAMNGQTAEAALCSRAGTGCTVVQCTVVQLYSCKVYSCTVVQLYSYKVVRLYTVHCTVV